MAKLFDMGNLSAAVWRRSVAIVAVGLALASSGATVASPSPPEAVIDRPERDCTQIPPETIPAIAPSTSEPLALQVRVMFERGDKALVRKHMKATERAYERIGIELGASYNQVVVPKQWKGGGAISSGASPNEHLAFMKKQYGGKRPKGVDIVYFFSRYWAGGMADCIGGVRYPDLAFAFGSVGSVESKGSFQFPPTSKYGVIAAHEIGHLLGADHHYSNCVEAAPWGALEGQAAACTTMSPSAGTASLYFGVVETSFVRYYVEEYAQDK